MSQNKFLNIVIVILILFVIASCFITHRFNKCTIDYLKDESVSKDIAIDIINMTRNSELKLSGMKIPETLYLTDDHKQEFTFAELLSCDKLIFRFSELNCNICIETELAILNSIVDSLEFKHVMIITSSKSTNYIVQFKRVNNLKMPIYCLRDSEISDIPDIGTPYYFVLSNTNYRIMSPFIPDKEKINATKQYLNNVIGKYYE